MAKEIQQEDCYVALTYDHLDVKAMMDRVRSPKAGAIVLFAGNCCENLNKVFANMPKAQLATILVESQ
jgi:molybdopterin synthase catalytic subunit